MTCNSSNDIDDDNICLVRVPSVTDSFSYSECYSIPLLGCWNDGFSKNALASELIAWLEIVVTALVANQSAAWNNNKNNNLGKWLLRAR